MAILITNKEKNTNKTMQPKGLMRYTLKRDDMPNLRLG